jgi:adenine-specific DNA-methyltransferase
MSKEQKVTGNIQPPNKDLEILKQNFPNCFDKNGEFDFEKFKIQLSKNEINFSKESYGMDWLGKSYARLLATDEATTLLKEDETFNQKEENRNSENLLIKGDNLEVLKHLSNAYYEKIKMIYIDPPYNTGSDGFVYADNRKFTIEELQELAGISEERAKRILDFTQSNSNSHSAWLTFMYPRLYIARQLLGENGIIFISIDDNEIAQLKMLMDEIFGEENFVGNIVWKHTEQSKNDERFFSRQFNYQLVYIKSDETPNFRFPRTEKDNINYSNPDNDKNGDWRSGDVRSPNFRKTLCYDLKTPSGKLIAPPDKGWRWKEDTIQEKIDSGEIIFNSDETKIIRKIYLANQEGRVPENLWQGELYGTTRMANSEIKELFEDSTIFDTPKPTQLIKRIMQLFESEKDFNVLDFFAGSGTTGDAVMQLNIEDNGNRKFILAQLPELIDPKSNKTAYDFVKNELKVETPTIFEITKERLIRASKKIQEQNVDEPAKSEKIKCEGCGESGEHCHSCKGEHTIKIEATKKKDLSNQDLGFKVFETMPIWEDYNFESEELEKQTSLFDESKLTKEDIKSLLVTWKTYDGISLTEIIQETDLKGYTAHYSNEKLYLMDKGFTTKNLKTLLEKIDSDKNFNPATIVAFGYHFESKILREISENIKSYANKKSIDIDFITRY